MYEIKTELELLLDGRIMCVNARTESNLPHIFPFGTMYSHMGPVVTHIELKLAQNDYLNPDPYRFLHVFRGISRHVNVVRVRVDAQQYIHPLILIDFSVYDMQGFLADVHNHHWNSFNEQFNEQLDSVLKEEV